MNNIHTSIRASSPTKNLSTSRDLDDLRMLYLEDSDQVSI